jgi:hypothetical protein
LLFRLTSVSSWRTQVRVREEGLRLLLTKARHSSAQRTLIGRLLSTMTWKIRRGIRLVAVEGFSDRSLRGRGNRRGVWVRRLCTEKGGRCRSGPRRAIFRALGCVEATFFPSCPANTSSKQGQLSQVFLALKTRPCLIRRRETKSVLRSIFLNAAFASAHRAGHHRAYGIRG